MKKYKELLASVNLFHGIPLNELIPTLDRLMARTEKYEKGAQLLTAGSKPDNVGVVLSGQLHIIKEDVDGNRTLLSTLYETDIFAETLCCANVEESPVTVLADTDSVVLLLPLTHILNTCPNACGFRGQLLGNMLKVVAQKNLYLQGRIELIRIKSVRTKVLGYLNTFAVRRGETFSIPLNREEMADYLCVERSALSHELMRMKRDRLIDYSKNRFTIW